MYTPFTLHARSLLTMHICYDEFSQCTRKRVYVILVIKLLIFNIIKIYEFMHGAGMTWLDNRSVWIIEVRIIEVGLYTLYLHYRKLTMCMLYINVQIPYFLKFSHEFYFRLISRSV